MELGWRVIYKRGRCGIHAKTETRTLQPLIASEPAIISRMGTFFSFSFYFCSFSSSSSSCRKGKWPFRRPLLSPRQSGHRINTSILGITTPASQEQRKLYWSLTNVNRLQRSLFSFYIPCCPRLASPFFPQIYTRDSASSLSSFFLSLFLILLFHSLFSFLFQFPLVVCRSIPKQSAWDLRYYVFFF